MIASVRAPSLVEAAATRLRTGPASTIELARDVLRVAGPPGPVAAAVHTLLGADERFCVDGSGTWSFDDGRAGPDLATLDFAVVDVETTGGSFAAGHRIVEIAVVPVSGGQIGGVWSTLVNPGRLLPRAVQSLTGIGDSVVLDAPYFDHVADEVSARLAAGCFVAHNATFDWRFVSAELVRALGSAPSVPRLCTVRLTRRLLPSLRRRSLDAVTRHYGIQILDRHRAHGDAVAAARVLLRLLDEARRRGITNLWSLQRFVATRSQGRRARI